MYCIYKHTFPNNKIYIGITAQNPARRWAKGHGYKKQPCIYHAINKYGWESIQHEILFTGLNKEEAEKKEIELIAKYKSNQKKYGYNVANGGNATGTVSKETRIKISMTLKGRPKEKPPFKGKQHSIETKTKLSKLRKGEHNPMYGKHITEETRAKMSKAHKKCSLCKTVICIETGEVFISASEAARKIKTSQGNISAVARGEKKHIKGYHFIYQTKEVTH